MPNTSIPNQQVALIDSTSKISTTWFTFLLYLFKLTGGGKQNLAVPVGAAVATLDFPNTLAQQSADLTVTVPGVADGDLVTVGVPVACMLANCCYTGYVSAPDVVSVRLNNYSAAAQNPPSGKFQIGVSRYQE